MSRLSDNQIAGAVRDAGFPRASWNVAIAVALAESSGVPTATHRNSNGSTDYGLFQINSIHTDILNSGSWSDPVSNAKMALAISSNGSNWAPWTTYTSGVYRVFLPRAGRATGSPVSSSGGAVSNSGVTQTGLSGSSSITNPGTWMRIGFVLAGAILILIALSRMTTIDNTIAKGALKAGEIAAVA